MWHWELAPFGLSALLTALCAVFVWQRRSRPGARAFAGLLISETAWSVGYVGELSSAALSRKILWDNIQLLAFIALLVSTLVFVWRYRQHAPKHQRFVLIVYMVAPVLAASWVFTDPWHQMARSTARIEPAPPFGALLYDFTAIELLLNLQAYATVLYVAWSLFRASVAYNRVLRLQTLLIVAGLVFPTLTSIPGLLGLRLLGQRDMAPASFGIAALAIAWAMFRGRFFDIAPIARHVVFGRLPDPVLVLDVDERVVDLNPCAQALLEPQKRVVGRTLVSMLPAEPARRLTSLGAATRVEIEISGQTFEARSEPLDEGGREGRVILLRDISERRAAEQALQRAQEALEVRVTERTRELQLANDALTLQIAETKRLEEVARQSEARFRSLFDHAVELMGTLSADGRVLAANRAALELAGVKASEVVGSFFWDGPWWRHSEDLRTRVRDAVARAANGEFVTMEVTHPDLAGGLRNIDFSLKPLASTAEEGLILIAEGRDITELRRAEQERLSLKEALHSAQRLESIGRLAGGIAHDFNNLLTVILGQLDLAIGLWKSGRDPCPSLEQATQAGMSAADLTRQLLAFARKQPAAPRVVSINEVVGRTHQMLARVIGEDIRLQLQLAPELDRVCIDPAQLEQVLLNLAVNARDAMPSGGELNITTANVLVEPSVLRERELDESKPRYVRMEVRDTGTGMSSEVLARVFEPFFTTKPPGKGTGIGLSTVYGVLRQANGFVQVASQPGHGTCFAIYLPATDSEVQIEAPPKLQVPGGSERVALVEDQEAVRTIVAGQLSGLGYSVTTFSRAEDAMGALSTGAPDADLLVTDVVLSGMTGPAMVQLLRKARPDLKVLYVSGYTDGALLGGDVDGGAVHLLHKPFTTRELAQAVRAALEETL